MGNLAFQVEAWDLRMPCRDSRCGSPDLRISGSRFNGPKAPNLKGSRTLRFGWKMCFCLGGLKQSRPSSPTQRVQVIVWYILLGPKHLLRTYYNGTWTLWVRKDTPKTSCAEQKLAEVLGFGV